ncbi:MAG: MATE family efflux transporter [Thermodesulfovibrionales bacterium]
MSNGITSSLRTAAKGTAFVLAGMAASQALWFVIRLLLVRNLSKEDLGMYSLVIAVVSIVSMMASVGLWEGATRYISIFLGQGRKVEAAAVHRSSLMIGAAAGTGACVVLLLFSGVLSRYIFYKPELSTPLMVMSFFIPVFVMAFIIASILRGYGTIIPKVYFMDIGQPLLFFGLLCLIFLLGLSFISIIWAYVLSMAAVFVLIAYYGYRKTGVGPFAFRGGGYVGELLKFSVPILSLDITSLILRWADTLMLGRYRSAEEVGVYSVSVSLAVFLTLPLMALDNVYMPIAGELYAQDRSADLARSYQVLTKWIISVTLPIFFILFFFPGMTITLLFGERFADSVLPLRILSLGYLFNAFMGTNILLLLVLGLSKAVMKVCAAGTLLNVLLNYVLIKQIGLGTEGAALSSMVSLLATGGGYSYVLYKHSGLKPIASGLLKPVIGSAVIGAIIYAVAKSLPLYFWMLPVYFLLYICGYIALLILTRSLDAEDVFLFGEILKKAGVAPEAAQKIIGKIYKRKGGNPDLR